MEPNNPNIDEATEQKDLSREHDHNLRVGHQTLKIAMAKEGKSKNKESIPEDIEKIAESFNRRYSRVFNMFSRNSTLRYKIGKNDTFSFEPRTNIINVPIDWFVPGEYSEDELAFVNLHERSHFLDMQENPEAYLDNFKKMQEKARELAIEFVKKHPKNKVPQEKIEGYFYKQIHTLYNCLDDIYVNHTVKNKSVYYNSGSGSKAITSVYAKNNFKNPDMSKAPLQEQFAFALLRNDMVGDAFGKTIVSPEVEEKLNMSRFGAKNIQDYVSKKLKENLGTKEGKEAKNPEHRYNCIRATIEPLFLQLLEMELKNREQDFEEEKQKKKQQQNDQNGGGLEGKMDDEDFNPFSSDEDDRPKGSLKYEPSDDEIKKVLEDMQEGKRIQNMSQEELAEYDQEQFDKKHNITKEERMLDTRIREKIQEARATMLKFWQNLIGKAINYRQATKKNQTSGRLDIGSVINNWATIVEGQRSGEERKYPIYERQGLERQVVNQPERIEVSLAIDKSRSMSSGMRVQAARETAALLLYSLQDFNEQLRYTKDSNLEVDSEVYGFGHEVEKIKDFGKNQERIDENISIIKTISEIDAVGGATYDHLALNSIRQSISIEDKRKIDEKKLLKIVFEITDGNPTYEGSTKEAIKSLADDGVIVVGFQIGAAQKEDIDTFNGIWNNDQIGQKGIYIGENVSELPMKLMEELADILNDIRI